MKMSWWKPALAGAVCVLAMAQTVPADEVRAFIDKAEARLLELANQAGQASWVQSTYITQDTEAMAARASQASIEAGVAYAKQAAKYRDVPLSPEYARKRYLLGNSLTLAAPEDPAKAAELTQLVTGMEGTYGRGKFCPKPNECLDVNDITKIMAESRDPKRLLEVWVGWRTISVPIRKDFPRYVSLANEGARGLGFADTGAMWRSGYDMPPAEFAKEMDRLWEQVKPLYVSLHSYVRWKLREKYGAASVPEKGPIPAHLLGNIWAQSWENVGPIVKQSGTDPAYDLTKTLVDKKVDSKEMVRIAERFFMSLGFAALPQTFWERSLFLKPADREVVCHASAWDVNNVDDLRIKMCIQITAEDFQTIHHELGHNFYQRAYNQQPFLFRGSANDGFHEALGDTVALSITPEYLVKIGFLDKAPEPSSDTGLLLDRALEKVAFLPFGLLVDQWRWKVFAGEVTPANYNAAWWTLRQKYQGVAAPVDRSEADFDPGAKYHVAANVPYARYFLADILQFQFHRALARQSGCKLPLHRCSVYGNRQAGERLQKMMAMGSSQPWPEALYALTGERQMDATAMLEYFAPLKKWLDEQNQGKPVGW